MKLREIIEIIFIPLAAAAVAILWDMNKTLTTLNVQVGVLLATTANAEKRVDGLEFRVEKLESHKHRE